MKKILALGMAALMVMVMSSVAMAAKPTKKLDAPANFTAAMYSSNLVKFQWDAVKGAAAYFVNVDIPVNQTDPVLGTASETVNFTFVTDLINCQFNGSKTVCTQYMPSTYFIANITFYNSSTDTYTLHEEWLVGTSYAKVRAISPAGLSQGNPWSSTATFELTQ